MFMSIQLNGRRATHLPPKILQLDTLKAYLWILANVCFWEILKNAEFVQIFMAELTFVLVLPVQISLARRICYLSIYHSLLIAN